MTDLCAVAEEVSFSAVAVTLRGAIAAAAPTLKETRRH